MTLSANYTTTLDRAIEKELGKGSTVHTMVGDKSKPNTLTIVVHAPALQPNLEDKVAAAVKKALKAEAYAITFNSPKKFQDSVAYTGKFVVRWPTVKEDVELPLLRTLIEAGIPKMIAPGIRVTVPQAMRDKLMAAMEKLNYVPEGSGYSDGSTSWTAIASISADFDVDKFTSKLRKALGDHEGELNVRYYDLAKE